MVIIEKCNCNCLSIDYHGIKLFFISPEQFQKVDLPGCCSKPFNSLPSKLLNLQNIVDGKATLGNTKFGPKPALSDYEPLLVHWIEAMSQRGFPIIKQNLLVSIGKMAKEMGVDQLFNGNPGKKWFKLFMKRNPSIAKRTVQKVTKSRNFLIENNLMDILENPSRIFNTDESGFMLCPKGEKVLCMRGEKNVYEVCGNNDKQQITVLVNISADGVVAPTMLVFYGKQMPKGIAKTILSDWFMAVSAKGWITGETFFENVANVFYSCLMEKKIQLPVILFLDGHVSHLTYHLSMFYKDKGIHIIAFYPNSTHIQQPLDGFMDRSPLPFPRQVIFPV
ncbi:uncharacterized protein LOC132932965 [Metopolophium dirhodum]|uniref:uncharacterized protein LOC132932965 n=1 Tax=Metopolophium dirhodum TaxID=44670 RepID=UPI00298FFE65|nr:uncharacterized protein LOC132932965 [Metopolophium dirhodum]